MNMKKGIARISGQQRYPCMAKLYTPQFSFTESFYHTRHVSYAILLSYQLILFLYSSPEYYIILKIQKSILHQFVKNSRPLILGMSDSAMEMPINGIVGWQATQKLNFNNTIRKMKECGASIYDERFHLPNRVIKFA